MQRPFRTSGFVLLLVTLWLITGCAPEPVENPTDDTEAPVEIEEIPTRYGIPLDAYKIHNGVIKKNEFLADILLGYGVPYNAISSLAAAAKEVHDVRKLKAGDKYAMFCAKDSGETACYFVVETGAADYVVYQLNDSIAAYLGKKPVTHKIRKASGVINSSLYQTIADHDLSPELAMRLGDIYAWTVDFYRIQRGDAFKVIFEELYVDDEPIGVGKILAAEFIHRDEKFFSFRFEQDSVANYFDENGESLRKAFLKAPLKFSRISSRYTMRRYHPVQKRWKAHLGTDYAAPTGTPILSTGDGTVIASTYTKFNGNYVKIKHNSTYTTQYLHMSKRAVKKGEFVRQGEVIGYVGSTGLATGPHVCYRFWKNGKQVDPYQQDLPPSEPVNPKYLQTFNTLRDSLSGSLATIPIPEVET